MNSFLKVGKFLDQPRLVGKFSQIVPAALIAGGAICTFNNVNKAPEKEKNKTLIRNIAVMIGTIGSALIATRGIKPFKIGSKTFKGFEGLSERLDLKEIKKEQSELIDEFLKENPYIKCFETLNKAKDKILNPSEIKEIFEELEINPKAKEFLTGEKGLIPDPENVDSKEIFSEIGRLSLMGLVPVIGGITGGIIGDKLTDGNWKDKIPAKLKEGTYQYLANIFLCNVGAGAALFVLEKANVKSKSARAIGMIGGILLAGVAFGSAIANAVGKFCIDPLIHHNDKNHIHHHAGLYEERKPEAIDIGLHLDDVATVAVLSGLKWIEPALPMLYSVSGYRAGIGYRNGEKNNKD